MGWSKIIRPKDEGGHGIKAARAKNISLLAKFNWRLYHEKESMWAKVLLSKYCSHHRGKSLDPDKLPCSSNWAAIKVGFPIFKQGICSNVGNKSKLNFWESNWVKDNTVKELIEGPLTQQEEAQIISEVHQNGNWNWGKISFDLPRMVVDRIQAIPIQAFGEREDTLMWRFSPDGEFNMAPAYHLAIAEQPRPPPFTGY